ncbi:MAG: ABC transporter permease [Chthoniobacterales bacterium]
MLNGLRFALRSLSKAPGFTLVAITALALGIGTTTTAFSVFNGLFLRPTPLMSDQGRVVYVSEYLATRPDDDVGLSYPDYLDWKKEATSFEGIGGLRFISVTISGGENPQRYFGARISADTFAFLGVQPVLGRGFRAEDDELNAPPVVLIGYDLWQRRFGGERSIVGRAVAIDGKQVTVVGVMPKAWRFPNVQDLWMPLPFQEKDDTRSRFSLLGYAKIRKGVSLAQARAELEAINGRLAAEYPETNAGRRVHITPLREQMTGSMKPVMLLVMGAVVLVQLIACGNLANLLLARGAARTHEFAIRLALGAGRAQIVRHLLGEALVIGAAGSALGLIFASWGSDLVRAAFPSPYWIQFGLDWRACLFAIGAGIISTVLFGLYPALQTSRLHVLDDLKEASRTARGGVKARRARNSLVVAQVALAMVLLIAASLMLRSLLTLQTRDLGADPSDTLTFWVGMPRTQFPGPDTPASFFEQLIPRLNGVAGVEATGAVSSLPGTGATRGTLLLEGENEPARPQEARSMTAITITPGFLRTARIPLWRGRDFDATDRADAPHVVLIDEEAARRWFPNLDPVGHSLRALENPGDPPKWATIVGVVKSVAYDRLRARAHPAVYFPLSQHAQVQMAVAVRTKIDPTHFARLARETVASLNKELPIQGIESMNEVLTRLFWLERFLGWLFAVFAALALLLASLGLYGVISYSVRQRTHEIGVRMALGAQAADVMRMVTGQGMRLIGFGLVVGSVAAYFLMKLFAGKLQGVSAHDPLSFAAVASLLLVVGLTASYIPARAAMRLNPLEALRHE